MNTADMLVTLRLREAASELRSAAKAEFYASIFDKIDDAARSLALDAWDRDHPIDLYIELALSELEDIATYLAQRQAVWKPRVENSKRQR